MAGASRLNLLPICLSVLTLSALFGLPLLRVAPNRLVSGDPLFASAVIPGQVWAMLALLLGAALIATYKSSRWWLGTVVAISAAMIPILLWFAASNASLNAQDGASVTRTSFGSAFWISTVLLAFLASSTLEQLNAAVLHRVTLALVVLICLVAILGSGAGNNLSLIKEYAQRADDFALLLARHVQIVLVALGCTVCLGLLLGWLAHARTNISRLLLPVLNIIQTIPSIALFGLLIAPLSLLAANVPALGRAGISGVGLAPAVVALTLYGLLPVVRSVLVGLQQVSASMHSAATALGLTPVQVLLHIELPLALPVLLGGVRTAAVATVGLAAVTALIGAGGLGSILFEGLFSSAQDLVLLGVLPIVALGMLVDALFKVLIGLARMKAHS